MRRPRRTALAALVMGSLGAAAAAGQQPPTSPPAPTPEARLWQSIVALSADVPATQPFDGWFERTQQQRARLIARVKLYQTLYPGGQHRTDAVRLELAALFDAATLASGPYDAFCKRVREHLAAPGGPAVEAEAAYWALICQRLERDPDVPTTRPAARSDAVPLAPALRAAYADYLRRYPQSRYVPRLARLLFADAAARDDATGMQAAIAHIGTHFPEHPTTIALLGAWNRRQAIGQPFWLEFRQGETEHDSRHFAGRPGAIVVWAGFDAAARQCVRDLEQVRVAHPTMWLLGVNVDADAAAGDAAARELGVTWPQFNDGLGWANRFALAWGVDVVPLVFVVDARGRLVGAASDERWRAWLRAACETPATQPALNTL